MRKKKLFLIVCCLSAMMSACFAQDVIVTRDSKKINAKVTEVNITDIKYKNFDNPDGPTYTLLKSDIASILYQNGSVETFEAEKPAPESPVATSLIQTNQQVKRGNLSDNFILYQKYRSGRKQTTIGLIVALTGVAIGGGITAVGIENGYDVEEYLPAAMLVGGACIATGVPLMIIGNTKKRSALREYERTLSETPVKDAPRFQLNMHGNGVGLAYVF
jgi:hypothetical protein